MVVTPTNRCRLSSKSSESSPLTEYFLGNNNEEVSRLDRQHIFHKSVFGYPRLLPPGIDTAHISRVIDVGAGTGAWVLDFLSLPDFRDRSLEVFACDISTEKFPQNDEPEVRKITFFQQDVTKPFPDKLLGTFDLINFRFLSYALTAQGWRLALWNLYSLLKPGGHLLVRDGDLITYNREIPPPPEGQEPDIATSLQGISNVANINRIFAGEALKRGFVVGLSYYLPRMLEEASFIILSSLRVPAPFGNCCDFFKSRNDVSLSEYKAFSISNYVRTLNTITLAATRGGGVLELADGTRIATEEGRLALMEEVTRCVMEGGFTVVSDWVAKRPLESWVGACGLGVQRPVGHAA